MTGNGKTSDPEARIALLQTENLRLQATVDELRREVEYLKAESIHDQSGWLYPGDPRGRVQG